MVAHLKITKKGRILELEHGDDFCRNCGLRRGDKPMEWYFYTGHERGLYCRTCAADASVLVYPRSENDIFYSIDEWEYINTVKGEKNGKMDI